MVTDRPLTDSLTALLYYRFQVLCSHVGGNIIIIVLEHLFCQQTKMKCPRRGTECYLFGKVFKACKNGSPPKEKSLEIYISIV